LIIADVCRVGVVTDGKKHEVTVARLLHLAPGTVVAMDRGYNDYRLFADWTTSGVFFVTRMKDNAVYEVVERRELPSGVISEKMRLFA
jgi:cation transport regulator ChaC